MKFIAFGDLDANAALLDKFTRLDLRNYDFMLYVGDMVSSKSVIRMGRARAMAGAVKRGKVVDPFEFFPKKFSREIETLKQIDNILGIIALKVPIFGIWGNADLSPLMQKTSIGNKIEIIHNALEKIRDFWLTGYSGRTLYKDEIENPNKIDKFGMLLKDAEKVNYAFNEDKVYQNLSQKLKEFKTNKVILVSHEPPHGILDQVLPKNVEWALKSYGEKAKEGHIGSTGLRKIIEDYPPFLHIFGHIHEAKGFVHQNKTTFINCGSFSNTNEFVDVEIKRDEIKTIWKNIDDFLS